MNYNELLKLGFVFFLSISFSLLLSPTAFGEHHEGSGTKREGSGTHKHDEPGHSHHEGSASKKHAEGSGSNAGEEAMMKKMQEYATPGVNHKILDVMAGNWDHTVKWWIGPNAPPEESSGTSSIEWILGGRFMLHQVEGEAMGQPFSGKGVIGYDTIQKKYESMWIDSMGTGIMKGTGHYDESSKTLSENGEFTCPFRGATKFRGKTKFISNNKFIYEMYAPSLQSEEEFLNMEITYTREK